MLRTVPDLQLDAARRPHRGLRRQHIGIAPGALRRLLLCLELAGRARQLELAIMRAQRLVGLLRLGLVSADIAGDRQPGADRADPQ
jgi:hypothetical protein